MWTRRAIVLLGWLGSVCSAAAQDFHIDEVSAVRGANVAQLKSGTIAFTDQSNAADADVGPKLIRFADWAGKHPVQKRFLALYPSYVEPTFIRKSKGATEPELDNLYMYVAQARFVLDRAPGAIDPTRYVTLPFLERIDPAIKLSQIAATDVMPFTEESNIGNENPDRKWCTGRATLICIQSTYRFEGKIPLGVLLVNKLRDSVKKVSDHIDFQGELSTLSPTDIDQAGVRELTGLDTPVTGVIEQNIFSINQVLRFGKLFGVFQNHPTDAGKTVVTAFMTLAIEGSVLDKKRDFENVPVLRNLVPAQVLMGQSSFNSGNSISAGLPKYARNEISTIAGMLARAPGGK
jgi:hypothetical protein